MVFLRASFLVFWAGILVVLSPLGGGAVVGAPVSPEANRAAEATAGSSETTGLEDGASFKRFSRTRARLGVEYNGISTSDLKLQPIPGIDDLGVTTTALDADLSCVLAPLEKHGSSLTFDVSSRWLILSFVNLPVYRAIERFDRHLYVGLGSTYRGKFGVPWGVQARFSAGVASTLEEQYYGSDWWVFQGGLWLLYTFRSGLTAGLGVVHTFDYGKPMWLPAVLVEYQKGPYRVDVDLPNHASFWYRIVGGLSVGVMYQAWGMRYARDRLEFPEIPAMQDPYLGHSALTMGAGVEYVFDNRFRLAVEGGYTLSRYLRVLDGSSDVLDLDPKNAPFVRATVSLGGGL